ncbi:UNVERIFIED_CONTAM: Ribosome biogenesis protein bop1-B [Sesamum radiatum]|uniref:Ribosome biogenesis protein bop1-B n=1 Tax=Sesamum radiatum TaxID=300843 RepID=A0AAW2W164_SESRA
MEDNHMEESEQKLETEVAPALIAVHPSQIFVSVSVGSELRVFSLQDGSPVKLVDETGGHKDSIRAIRYSRSGQFFVSGGDDKLVKVWDINSWRCIYSVVSEKRVTSLAISGDGMFVCFADKFGVVYVVDIGDHNYENPAPVHKKAVPILSHYCSIITRLVVSVEGETFIPTSIGAAPSSPLLWMVMGASSLQSNDSALLARVRAVSGFTTNTSVSTEPEMLVLEDTEIPGGEPLLQALQGKLSIGEEAFSTAAEAVKTAMRNLLIKKQYSAERREFRKRGRNDKKNQTPA